MVLLCLFEDMHMMAKTLNHPICTFTVEVKQNNDQLLVSALIQRWLKNGGGGRE